MEGEHSLGTPLATCALCRQAYSLLTYYVRLTSLAIIELAPGSEYSVLVSDRDAGVAEPDCGLRAGGGVSAGRGREITD